MANRKSQSPAKLSLRNRAGNFLSKSAPELAEISPIEIQELVHELDVYQMEVDLQNEQLRQTLEQLEAIRTRYVTLFDFAPIGYFVFDSEGLIREVNLTGAALLGKDRTDLIGTPFVGHIHPPSRNRFQRHLKEVFSEKIKKTCTLQVVTAAGALVHVALESLVAQGQEVSGFQSYTVVIDITVHHQTMDALRLTQAVMDRAAVAVFWIRPDGKFAYVNHAACESLGYTRHELLNMAVTDINHDLSLEKWSAHWQDLEQSKTRNLRVFHSRKDGSRFPVEISANYQVFGDQEFNIAFAADITARNRAEEELKTAVAYLENIIASSADPIATVDEHGHFTRWNQAAEKVYGYTSQELSNQNAFILYPDSNKLEKMLTQLRRDGFVQGYEIDMKKKDGLIVPFSLSIRLLRNEAGKTLGSVCVARDLTVIKKSLEELNASNAKLRTLVQESDRRNRELTLINSMAEKLQSCLSEQEAYPIIGQHAQILFPARAGALFIQDRDNNLLEEAVTWGDALVGNLVFSVSDCWALRRGRLNLGGDLHLGLPCRHMPHGHAENYLCLPLLAHSETLGMLHIQGLNDLSHGVEQQLQTLAVTVGDHISLALANIRLRETLRHQVVHDALTGLFNRRYLEETLEREIFRARRKGAGLGLIMLDLDHFKRFNDTFGHEAGDELLRALGTFLNGRIRQEDVACRYGGEEFVLILPEASREVVMERAEDIREGFRKLQVFHRGRVIESVTISLGVAMFPEDGASGQDVLRAADDALYQAKAQGRNQVVAAPPLPV